MADLVLDFELYRHFAFYAIIVILKMFLVQVLTPIYRHKKKVFETEEDVNRFIGDKREARLITDDPDVNRLKRIHNNDLENVIPFVIVGSLFVITNPSFGLAVMLFRIFAVSRIFHTVAFMVPLPQPSRSIGFITGMVVNLVMALFVLKWAFF